jgi:hypothetical protein
MTLSASGFLGVGTTSPTRCLSLDGGSGTQTWTGYQQGGSEKFVVGLDASGNPTINGTTSTPLIFKTNDTERARIDSSGNLGVGVTSITGGYKAQINGNLLLGTAANPLLVGTTSLNFLGDNASSSGMRLDSSGNLLVGTTSTGYTNTDSFTLEKANGYEIVNHTSSRTNGAPYILFGYNGGSIGGIVQNGTTAVSYNTSSDYRLKNTIAPMTGALDKVALLKPCTYKWNTDGSDGEGFIAHELAEVVPQCVTGEKDAVDEDGNPKYQGIDTSFLVATLTAALQEAHGLIKSLETRISALEAK